MKNNKGITLISIIVYIAIVFVVTAVVMRITIHFRNNVEDAADVSFETEFQKINFYLLDETKTLGNGLEELTSGMRIKFTKGNTYKYNYEDKTIYLNDNIKICENIESCTFSKKKAEKGKDVLGLTLTINGTTKTTEYVITGDGQESGKVNIEDYLVGQTLASYYLQVGDYVDYTPTAGTYTVSSTITGYTTTTEQNFETETGGNALKWRVLSIDEKTGEIELVSATVAKSLGTLYLTGTDGYNHAVDILNDLCKALYSNTNGATARSINVEDINAKTTYNYTTYVNYGTIETPNQKKYPSIYIAELGSTANGLNETENLLKESEGVRNTDGTADYTTYTGSSTASTLYVTQTYYNYIAEDYLNTNLGINTSPEGLLNVGQAYWLASRDVSVNSDHATFGVRYIDSYGKLQGKDLFISYNSTPTRKLSGSPSSYFRCYTAPRFFSGRWK